MIAIINIDKNVRQTGYHLYSLSINEKGKFYFSHKREEPLSACLLSAYEAAVKDEEETMIKIMRDNLK